MTQIKYSNQIPPIYEECKKAFGASWDRGVVITYGDTIYCKFDISEDLKIHEAVHVRQQSELGIKEWWDKYLVDGEFRLAQETEAYQAQIKWANENYNRSKRKELRKHIIKCMTTLYGDMCTKEEAEKLIN